jgi:hypothetical protein
VVGASGQRSRRVKVSADKPLSLGAVVYRDETYSPLAARLFARLAGLFGHWPTYRETAGGRQGAWLLRGLVIAAAVALAVKLPRPVGDLLGLAVGCLALVVPMAHLAHERRLARLRRLAAPRSRPMATPAELFYDGQKLTIRAESRVWFSLRVEAATARVTTALAPEGRWLGLSVDGRSERDVVWFLGPAAQTDAAFAGGAAPTRPPRICHLDATAFAALRDVFVTPPDRA